MTGRLAEASRASLQHELETRAFGTGRGGGDHLGRFSLKSGDLTPFEKPSPHAKEQGQDSGRFGDFWHETWAGAGKLFGHAAWADRGRHCGFSRHGLPELPCSCHCTCFHGWCLHSTAASAHLDLLSPYTYCCTVLNQTLEHVTPCKPGLYTPNSAFSSHALPGRQSGPDSGAPKQTLIPPSIPCFILPSQKRSTPSQNML